MNNRLSRSAVKWPIRLPGWAWVLAAVFGSIILFCGGAAGVLAVLAKMSADAASRQEALRTYPQMTADELVSDWSSNSVSAADRYKASGVTVRGRFTTANENWFFQDYIELGPVASPRRSESVRVFLFSDATRQQLRGAKIGDAVTIRCVATGQATEMPYLQAVQVVKIDAASTAGR